MSPVESALSTKSGWALHDFPRVAYCGYHYRRANVKRQGVGVHKMDEGRMPVWRIAQARKKAPEGASYVLRSVSAY